MKATRGRLVLTLLTAIAVASASPLAAGSATAQTVRTGSLSFVSDPGDPMGLGESHSYDTTAGDTMTVFGSDGNNRVQVNVSGVNGDWWQLILAAPQGPLVPGTYSGATPVSDPVPGTPSMEFSGNGRFCSQITGSFTVVNADFGTNGYVQRFDATFEQFCDGAEAALRGQAHITNPPQPPPLEIGVSVAPDGTVSTVSGTPPCMGGSPATSPSRSPSGSRFPRW